MITWDYVSPGMTEIILDSSFPYMIEGNRDRCGWKYLRREIPHKWYVDKRNPGIGFLSRDEAHILHNNALSFKNRPALEIGCWMGWSAAHLMLSKVDLAIIDPILSQQAARESILASLRHAATSRGLKWQVRLCPGHSPGKAIEVSRKLAIPWSFIFIDGDHEGRAPLEDARACAPLAANDAMILFHDLASPAVSRGLDYLKEAGWSTLIYQTMQLMGVAWRGNVTPVHHTPDPKIIWPIVEHLRGHPISGSPDRAHA